MLLLSQWSGFDSFNQIFSQSEIDAMHPSSQPASYPSNPMWCWQRQQIVDLWLQLLNIIVCFQNRPLLSPNCCKLVVGACSHHHCQNFYNFNKPLLWEYHNRMAKKTVLFCSTKKRWTRIMRGKWTNNNHTPQSQKKNHICQAMNWAKARKITLLEGSQSRRNTDFST